MKPLTDAEAEALIETIRNEAAWRAGLLERRERIATATLQGLLAGGIGAVVDQAQIVAKAVSFADALIAELGREPQR